jgi:hypothetical protein
MHPPQAGAAMPAHLAGVAKFLDIPYKDTLINKDLEKALQAINNDTYNRLVSRGCPLVAWDWLRAKLGLRSTFLWRALLVFLVAGHLLIGGARLFPSCWCIWSKLIGTFFFLKSPVRPLTTCRLARRLTSARTSATATRRRCGRTCCASSTT